jgi:hypothetical protein
MEPGEEKIDAAVLALLWLTLHDGCRVWKGSTGMPWIGSTARD